MTPEVLSDAEVFGAPSQVLSDADVFGSPEPTTGALDRASRPATGIRTRGGQFLFTEPEPYRDNWDRETQGEQRAPWTGEGGVLESLPAQMVAGTRSAVANLRRMLAEESAAQRRPVVSGPAVAETPAGAVTGFAAPGSIEKQRVRLVANEDEIMAAAQDAARATGDLQAVTPHGMNTAQQAASSLAQSAPPTALGIAAGILTKNPALAMAIAGGGGSAIQTGATYGKAGEKGASHRLSAMAATIDGILEGVGEALPLRIVLKSGSPIMARIFNTIVAESGQEAGTAAMQGLNAYLTYDPDITFNEVWHDIKVSTLAGFMGGSVYGTVGAAADHGRPLQIQPDKGTDIISGAAFDAGAAVEQSRRSVSAPTPAAMERAPALPAPDVPAAPVSPELPATEDFSHNYAREGAISEDHGVVLGDAEVFADDPAPLLSDEEVFGSQQALSRPAPDESVRYASAEVERTPAYTPSDEDIADIENARPDAIRRQIRDLLNVPINEGGFTRSRDVQGLYRQGPQTIRVRNQNDIGVIAHETGHHLLATKTEVYELTQRHAKELARVTPYSERQKGALKGEEGFAEYLRLLWTQPAKAAGSAPRFHEAFQRHVDEAGLRQSFNAIQSSIHDWQKLPPVDRIFAKVGGAPKPTPKAAELRDRFIQEVLDKWHPLKRMVADLQPGIAPSKDPFKASHLLSGDSAIIEDWIARQTIPFDPARRMDPANYGKPLKETLKAVSDNPREFAAYLIARRADELSKQGKEHLFTEDEIRAGLALETPTLKQAASEIYDYNNRLLEYAVEGGLLSPSVADTFRLNSAYVPFFRETPDGERRSGGKNPFKRLLGGTENLRDPVSNLIQNTANIIYATNRNAVLVKAYELAKAIPGGGRWMEEVPIPQGMVPVPTKAVLNALEKQGVALDAKSAQALDHIQKLIVPQPVEDQRERIVIVRVKGEPKALQINDPLLWKALQSFEPADMGIVEMMLAVPSDLLRAGVVLSPDFMVRNFMRDTLSGFIQSKAGILPVLSTLDGFKEIATRSDAARLYRAFGGAYADLWHGDSDHAKAVIERMAKRGGSPYPILSPAGVLDLLKKLGAVSEAGTRVAEFKKTAKSGDVDSHVEAAFRGREVSVDFGQHGVNRSVRLLTRITPFLNPAMQGVYKMARTGREQFFTTLLRGSVLTAASVLLYLNNKDEEWYDDLEQWEKNIYWHFDIGFRTTKGGRVIPVRIPKPFEWGAVFGSVPEALAELAITKGGKEFEKRLLSVLEDQFGLRAIPTALLLPAELWANQNQFTDRPIVPPSKEGLRPEFQANPGTSLAARQLGELTSTSPAKIDHAIRGIFGTLGVYATVIADLGLREFGGYPERLPAQLREIPVLRVFVSDPEGANSRYLTEFYSLLRESSSAERSMNHLRPHQMRQYYEKHRESIDRARSDRYTAREISKLRRENETVRDTDELPVGERHRIIQENNHMIRWLARDYVKEVNKASSKRDEKPR